VLLVGVEQQSERYYRKYYGKYYMNGNELTQIGYALDVLSRPFSGLESGLAMLSGKSYRVRVIIIPADLSVTILVPPGILGLGYVRP
jgi:hypothetical protein